jgi:hypothetical protein
MSPDQPSRRWLRTLSSSTPVERSLRVLHQRLPKASLRSSATAIVAAALLGIEALGLRSGGRGTVAAAVLVAVVSVLIIARVTVRSVGLGCAVLAAFSLPWNGWVLGGVRPGDLFILLAIGVLLAADVRAPIPRLPGWVTQVGLVVLVLVIVHEVLPTEPDYLASRVVVDAAGNLIPEIMSNIVVGPKLIVAVVGVTFAFCLAAARSRDSIGWLAAAYAAGTSVSGLIAFSDNRGLTTLGPRITGVPGNQGREAGLSDHPNFLAGSCVLAIGLDMWLLSSTDRRKRWAGIAFLPGIVFGTYASGSRGGAVVLVAVVVGCIVVIPRWRARLPMFALAGGVAAAAAFFVIPSFGAAVLKATRLSGGTVSTEGSNYLRALVGEQGLLDFRHSPLDGIGFQVAAEAQNVYIQQLAAGGLVLFTSLTVYMLWLLYTSHRLMPVSDLAGPLFVTLVGAAALNYVTSSLTDRFVYVPMALVVALAQSVDQDPQPPRGARTVADTNDPERPAVSAGVG